MRDRAAALALFALGFSLAFWDVHLHRRDLPLVQDESVYLFQAKTFAAGHATMPPPPLPEFFEAAHIIVVPRFTAKYFPGQALLLAPFVKLGAPWMLPAATLGLTAALIFLILRRIRVATWAAVLGSLTLLASGEAVKVWGTYLSQPTAAFWAMVGSYAALLLSERATPGRAALLGIAVGMAGLTRPFDGVSLGAAAAVLAVRLKPRPAVLLAALAPVALAGAGALAFSKAATGTFASPWAHYARQYMPFDGPGFGEPARVQPERKLPQHIERLATNFLAGRRNHRIDRLPAVAAYRAGHVVSWLPTLLLVPVLALGLWRARQLWFPLVFAGGFFALHLTMHTNQSFYLIECAPVVALLAGAGFDVLAAILRKPMPARWMQLGAIAATGVWALLVITALALEVPKLSGWWKDALEAYPRLEAALEPARRAHGLVFIHYPPGWNYNHDLGFNEPDLAEAELVRAIDLGPRNAELRPHFPGRPAFVFDAGKAELRRLW